MRECDFYCDLQLFRFSVVESILHCWLANTTCSECSLHSQFSLRLPTGAQGGWQLLQIAAACRAALPLAQSSQSWSPIGWFSHQAPPARSLPSPPGTRENCNKRRVLLSSRNKIFRQTYIDRDWYRSIKFYCKGSLLIICCLLVGQLVMIVTVNTFRFYKLILRCFFYFVWIPGNVRTICEGWRRLLIGQQYPPRPLIGWFPRSGLSDTITVSPVKMYFPKITECEKSYSRLQQGIKTSYFL